MSTFRELLERLNHQAELIEQLMLDYKSKKKGEIYNHRLKTYVDRVGQLKDRVDKYGSNILYTYKGTVQVHNYVIKNFIFETTNDDIYDVTLFIEYRFKGKVSMITKTERVLKLTIS